MPDPAYPFLGVHFTRRVDGGVDIGPNAVLAFKREGYRRTDFSAADCRVVRSQGFRRLARRHWRMGAREMWGSVSRRAFIARARDFVPALTASESSGPTQACVLRRSIPTAPWSTTSASPARAASSSSETPSPAATSSLAIGEYVVDQLLD